MHAGLEDAWDGFVSGQAPNESALAGSVAADLTGFGDMRDLFQQASRYIDGQEVDSFLVGLAAVGLGLTVATYASDGLLFSARSGVSTIKAAKRAGRLSPALVKHVGVLAADAVDTKAFGVMATSLKSLDLAAARAAAKALVKPQALGRISDLGSDVATIGSKVGYRGTLQTLAVAESAEDVSRVAKLSTRFGKATRGVLVLAGTALTFASVAGTATMWLVTLLFWAGAALMAVAKLAMWLGRKLWPTARAAPADRLRAGVRPVSATPCVSSASRSSRGPAAPWGTPHS